jgi:hypothetical protein
MNAYFGRKFWHVLSTCLNMALSNYLQNFDRLRYLQNFDRRRYLQNFGRRRYLQNYGRRRYLQNMLRTCLNFGTYCLPVEILVRSVYLHKYGTF